MEVFGRREFLREVFFFRTLMLGMKLDWIVLSSISMLELGGLEEISKETCFLL